MGDVLNAKIEALRERLRSLDLQGMIITNPVNISYLKNIDAEAIKSKINRKETPEDVLAADLEAQLQGLTVEKPVLDSDGNVIAYTVEEVWSKDRWTTFYGEITASGSSPPTYSTVITNTYYAGGPELPSTGTAARLLHILCGGGIMLSSLVYGIVLRRKRERRMK